VTWATLRFTPERARWVAAEQWHPNQEGRLLKDGSYELKVPYADDRELVMDILKYGNDCRVLAPAELVQRVTEELDKTSSSYQLR
jgi:predicted DNA-binding transcriptional regulator YafY